MNDTTNNLKLYLLSQNQSQKEFYINESMILLDAVSNTSLKGINVEYPPSNPSVGNLYHIKNDNIYEGSDWFNKKGLLASFIGNNEWRYIKPNNGLMLWLESEKCIVVYSDGSWIDPLAGKKL